ncbi:MAG: CSLREA domain-containing protein [Acidobacteriota bacterium]
MPKRRGVPSKAVPLTFIWIALSVASRAGTTIPVTTTADDLAIDGDCTLREAVIAANTDLPVDRCPAGSGADTILLPAGTYVLSLTGPGEDASQSGDLDISSDVTIRGAGAAVTYIDGGSFSEPVSDRVIHILNGAGLTLSGVTVQGGVCSLGGGIFNAGRLFVGEGTIRNNLATERASYCGPGGGGGGIYNQGELRMTRSTVSGNEVLGLLGEVDVSYPGGGLLNVGNAKIEQSVLVGNAAAGGGGIWNVGDLKLTDTWIAHNRARFWAAGLENRGRSFLDRTTVSDNSDGGIVNGSFDLVPGTLILRNSTLSGNRSFRLAGSLFNFDGPIDVLSSTVAANSSSQPGAGLGGATPQMRLRNTILANGADGDCQGPVTSLGNNLDSDGSCGLSASSDLPATDAQLVPLSENGGFTPTHALTEGSPAIDHIPTGQCGVSTDQRGISRPQPRSGACDVGAYEFAPSVDLSLTIDTVRRLGREHRLTRTQRSSLLGFLKPALTSVTNGDEAAACETLDAFSAEVSAYLGEGSVAPEDGRSLLDFADRIQHILCP